MRWPPGKNAYQRACVGLSKEKWPEIDAVVDSDPRKISWSRGLKDELAKGRSHKIDAECIVESMYRPFCKQRMYFNRRFNEMVYLVPRLFPTPRHKNVVISTSGVGASKGWSALVTDAVPNLHLHDTGQCFPLYVYESIDDYRSGQQDALLGDEIVVDGYVRREAIKIAALLMFQEAYDDKTLSKTDIFYYVYGLLHSPEYRQQYESDLSKMLPRIPFAKNFWSFSKAGRGLAKLHLDYESLKPYKLTEEGRDLALEPDAHYRVEKMVFGKAGKFVDKSVIHYNSRITLRGIPLEAYEYVVNGKSAIEWVMERYQLTKDKDSQLVNDPNAWCSEIDDPLYIINLVKRVVTVSLETVKIVKALPPIDELAQRDDLVVKSRQRA